MTETTAEHLARKAEAHEVALAAHLVYEHGQPERLPRTKDGLISLHATLHPLDTD